MEVHKEYRRELVPGIKVNQDQTFSVDYIRLFGKKRIHITSSHHYHSLDDAIRVRDELASLKSDSPIFEPNRHINGGSLLKKFKEYAAKKFHLETTKRMIASLLIYIDVDKLKYFSISQFEQICRKIDDDQSIKNPTKNFRLYSFRRFFKYLLEEEFISLDTYHRLYTFYQSVTRGPSKGKNLRLDINKIDDSIKRVNSLFYQFILVLSVKLVLKNKESLALKWEHFDVDQHTLKVDKMISSYEGYSNQAVQNEYPRTIKLDDDTYKIINKYRLTTRGHGFIFSSFTKPNHHIGLYTFRYHLRKALDEANLKINKGALEHYQLITHINEVINFQKLDELSVGLGIKKSRLINFFRKEALLRI